MYTQVMVLPEKTGGENPDQLAAVVMHHPSIALYYTPRKQSLGGYIGITLSVRPFVRLSVHPCTL